MKVGALLTNQKLSAKVMLILLFDSKSFVHQEFVPPGETVNAKFYLEVLDCLCKQIVCVRPEIGKIEDFFLLSQHTSTHGNNCATVFDQKGVRILSYTPTPPI